MKPHRSFITFQPLPPNPRTKRWSVVAKDGGARLGIISWFGRWRCYSFNPDAGTVFEKACLRDIAQFCETETKLHSTQNQ